MIGYASLYIHMHNNAQESSESVWKPVQNSVTKQLSNVFHQLLITCLNV